MGAKQRKHIRSTIIDALHAKYCGQIQEAKANIELYLSNPAGIGEHPDILEAIDTLVAKMVEAQEKKDALAWFEYEYGRQ